jgi:2-amino-4-hydroxy-6-hydroxymethyldihydropteridine diphosphokinase
MLHRAAVALGSNLGDRRATLDGAVAALRDRTLVRACSSVIETDPVGGVADGPFLNAACVLETDLPPRDLLALLLDIERRFGRDRARERRWGSRTLDLDLILYDDAKIDEPGLCLPHPRLHERLFVLDPLAEIAPFWVVPGSQRTVLALRDALRASPPPG